MTIRKLFNLYTEHSKSRWSKEVLSTEISNYNNYIYPHIGERNIDTLNFIDYQNLANTLLDSSLDLKSVSKIFSIVLNMIDYAKMESLYAGDNYARYVKLPINIKEHLSSSPTLQLKYIHAIINFDEPILNDIFLFVLNGINLEDVLQLKWEFIDFNESIIYLPFTTNGFQKTSSFHMSDKLVDILRMYQLKALDVQKSVFLSGHIFLNPITHKRYLNVDKAFKRLLKNSDLSIIKVSDIHYILGLYLSSVLNTPLNHVSRLLIHSSIKVTKKYFNSNPANSKIVMDNFFNSIKSKGEKYIEKLDESIGFGECIQAFLLSSKKFDEIMN